MNLVCVCSTADGNSYFKDLEPVFDKPLITSTMHTGNGWSLIGGTTANVSDWHRSPAPLLSVVLQGTWEVEVTSGEKRQLQEGDVFLGLDNIGQGHRSRVLGTLPCWVLGIDLTDAQDFLTQLDHAFHF